MWLDLRTGDNAHRKASGLNLGPSCCEATVLTMTPPPPVRKYHEGAVPALATKKSKCYWPIFKAANNNKNNKSFQPTTENGLLSDVIFIRKCFFYLISLKHFILHFIVLGSLQFCTVCGVIAALHGSKYNVITNTQSTHSFPFFPDFIYIPCLALLCFSLSHFLCSYLQLMLIMTP